MFTIDTNAQTIISKAATAHFQHTILALSMFADSVAPDINDCWDLRGREHVEALFAQFLNQLENYDPAVLVKWYPNYPKYGSSPIEIAIAVFNDCYLECDRKDAEIYIRGAAGDPTGIVMVLVKYFLDELNSAYEGI